MSVGGGAVTVMAELSIVAENAPLSSYRNGIEVRIWG